MFKKQIPRKYYEVHTKYLNGRKVIIRLPLFGLLVERTLLVSLLLPGPNLPATIPITVIIITIINREARICHNRKVIVNGRLKQFLALCFLYFESWKTSSSSSISKFVISLISVDIVLEALDSVSIKMVCGFLSVSIHRLRKGVPVSVFASVTSRKPEYLQTEMRLTVAGNTCIRHVSVPESTR